MFSDKCLSFRLELVDEFPKILPSTFGPFIGNHQRLLALGTILGNSSTNSNLKLKHLPENLKGILNKLYRQTLSLLSNEACLNE